MGNLTSLQIKALTHSKDLLDSYDSSDQKSLYGILFDILAENEITDNKRNKILNSFTDKLNIEKKKIYESANWIKSILND